MNAGFRGFFHCIKGRVSGRGIKEVFIYLLTRVGCSCPRGCPQSYQQTPPRGVGLTPPGRCAARHRVEALTRLTALQHERHPPHPPYSGGETAMSISEGGLEGLRNRRIGGYNGLFRRIEG